MRIVAGEFRGRVLTTPADAQIRPTSDRVREAIFSILSAKYSQFLIDANVLDAFAGTGALGLEALSRGAKFATFIDPSPAARGLIKANIEICGVQGKSKILNRDATNIGALANSPPFDLVLLDPPYRKNLGEAALKSLVAGGWLRPGALIVWEEDVKSGHAFLPAFKKLDQRKFGSSSITLLAYDG